MRALLLLALLGAPLAAQTPATPAAPAAPAGLSAPGGVGSPSPQDEILSLDNFKDCGFVSRFAGNKMPAECFQAVQNIVLDKDWTVRRRNGYAAYNATPCAGVQTVRGLWPFFATDGSQYLVVYSSASMFSSKGDGLCTPITGLSGNLSQTADMNCVQAMGYLWCANGAQQPFRTNVTSTDTLTNAPLGSLIDTFRNRIVISNVSGNLTNVYLSGELNGLDWSLPSVTMTTSPVIINISGTNDGLPALCLMGEFQNQFLIGRKYDLHGLGGYDTRDFALTKISNQIGCIDQKSVQEVNNIKYWLSERGVEGYTGTEITRVSYPIDNNLQAIISATGNSQSLTVNGNNFTTGNLTASGPGAPVSATIFPGNLVPSTWSVTDTAFVGTLTSATIVNGVLQISTGSPFINAGFEKGDLTNWTATGFSASGPGNLCLGGQYIAATALDASGIGIRGGAIGATLEVYNAANDQLLFSSTNADVFNSVQCTGTPAFVDLSTVAVTTIYVKAFSATSPATYTMRSVPFHNWADGFHYAWQANCRIGGDNACGLVFDVKELATGVAFASATFLSQVYDTGLSTPTWGPFSSTFTAAVSGSSVTFQTQTSTSASGVWTALTGGTDTVKIGSAQKEFIRYLTTIYQSTSTQVASVSAVGLSAATTGYYISPCITAVGITSWGIFSVDAVNNGGSFSFAMSTSAVSCAQVIDPKNANWTAVTPNTIVSVPVSSYTAVRVLFSLDAGTQTPTLNDFSVNWNAGGSRPPVASSRYNDEYWLFYTSNTAVGNHNDHALVYDQNRHWTLYDDINAYSAAIYLNTLYTGDSTATGTIYQQDTGSADNGGSFIMAFQTADLDAGDPLARKEYKKLYLTISAQTPITASLAVACNYTLDGSSTTYSLGSYSLSESLETGGYAIAKFPFPSGQAHTGHWISMSCSNTGSAGPINIYGLKLVYRKESWD